MQVNEIFTSLSGEADGFGTQGGLATFVRLQGCNLNCRWCDTGYAQDVTGGEEMSVEEVATQCTSCHIIITGGEPLLQQEEVAQLVDKLITTSMENDSREEYRLVTIETNGSLPITINPTRARYEFLRFVVDYKLSSSGMSEFMLPEVFKSLYSLDVIKFVIRDLQDYRQAKELVFRNQQWRAKKVFSPILGGGKEWPARLAAEIVKDKLEGVQLSLQWHKVLKIR